MNELSARAESAAPSDDGFTLVELLVSIALFSIVIVVVGGVLVSSFRADQTVRNVTTGTTDGQLVLNVISADLRASSDVDISAGPDAGSQFLALRTTPTGGPRCVGIFYDATSGEIRRTDSATAVPAPTDASDVAAWPAIATGIAPSTDEDGDEYSVFTADGDRGVTIRFTAAAGTASGSVFVTTASGRAPQSNESPACF